MSRDRNESLRRTVWRQAARRPEQTALRNGDRSLEYRRLDAAASGTARRLVEAGVGAQEPVGVVGQDAADFVVALLALLEMGGAYVPLDPRWPAARLREAAEAAEVGTLLVAPELRAEIEPFADGRRVMPLEPWAFADRSAGTEDLHEHPSSPDSLAYIVFTSGSTGEPKPIAGRLKAIAHFIDWEIEELGLGEGCRVSQLAAPTFDAFLRDVLTPLCVGGTIVAPGDRELLLDAHALAEWLERERVELVHCVPSLLRALLAEPLTPDRFPALKFLLLAGEALLPADVERWCGVFGDRVEMVNLYGPSETTMTKLFYRVRPQDASRRSIPIGQPMPGAQALVVDDQGQPCGPGRIGEILLRTPYRSLGYHRRPEATAEAFIPNPFSSNPEDRVFGTGHLGRLLVVGNFEFVGRRDGQVKIRGLRVEMSAIDNHLARQPGVLEAVTTAVPDRDGTLFLCAYLVLEPGRAVDPVRKAIAEELPEWMLPSVFVELEGLPRTVTGKIDRRALPSPGSQRREYVAPSSPAEEALAAVYAELLGLERVGVDESFFELGGHSLLATQLLARLRGRFQVEVSLRTLFRAPTVAALALEVLELQAGPDGSGELGELLDEIRGLSEEELEQELEGEAVPGRAEPGGAG